MRTLAVGWPRAGRQRGPTLGTRPCHRQAWTGSQCVGRGVARRERASGARGGGFARRRAGTRFLIYTQKRDFLLLGRELHVHSSTPRRAPAFTCWHQGPRAPPRRAEQRYARIGRPRTPPRGQRQALQENAGLACIAGQGRAARENSSGSSLDPSISASASEDDNRVGRSEWASHRQWVGREL